MRAGILSVVLLVLVSLTCAAAESPKVSLDAKDMTIEQVMAELSTKAGVQIVCESGVKGTVTGQFQSIELDKLLNSITKSNNLTWRKLYLPVPGEEKPRMEQIRARAEAVAALTGEPIVVCDPATGRQKVFVEQDPAAPSVDPEKLGLKAIYLIAKPTALVTDSGKDSQDLTARANQLQNERMQLLTQMTPEQRAAAMQLEMMSMMQLDPTVRQQIMLDQMAARRNMDPQMRDAYQQMMRDTFRSMRDQGVLPDDGRWQGRDGRGDGDRRDRRGPDR